MTHCVTTVILWCEHLLYILSLLVRFKNPLLFDLSALHQVSSYSNELEMTDK